MKTYPIMLDLRGKLAVVVGGGAVGRRKVAALRDAGARVRLIEPAASASAGPAPRAAKSGAKPAGGRPRGALAGGVADRTPDVEVVAAKYRPEYLQGATLAFACTDDQAVNAQIAADARRLGVLANAADQPEHCDFFSAAVASDGDVTLAVGTGGVAPALAGWLAGEMKSRLPKRIGCFARAVADLRAELRQAEPSVARRGEVLRKLAGAEGHKRFAACGRRGLRAFMRQLLKD